jgi:hypothetical protein
MIQVTITRPAQGNIFETPHIDLGHVQYMAGRRESERHMYTHILGESS